MHAYIVACLLETGSCCWDLDVADVGRWLWSWLGLCLRSSFSHRLHLLGIIRRVLKTTVSTGGRPVLSYATVRYKVRIVVHEQVLKHGLPMILCDCFQAEDQVERFLVVPFCDSIC